MRESDRGDRQDVDARFVDEKRVFVRAVAGTAVFDDAKPSRGHLLDDAMIQDDDAVGDVLLESLTGQHAVAALRRPVRDFDNDFFHAGFA